MSATLLEHINIGLYQITSSLATLLGREVKTLFRKRTLDIILVGNKQSYSIRRLVVVENHLVDGGTKTDKCLLYTLGAILLAVA